MRQVKSCCLEKVCIWSQSCRSVRAEIRHSRSASNLRKVLSNDLEIWHTVYGNGAQWGGRCDLPCPHSHCPHFDKLQGSFHFWSAHHFQSRLTPSTTCAAPIQSSSYSSFMILGSQYLPLKISYACVPTRPSCIGVLLMWASLRVVIA